MESFTSGAAPLTVTLQHLDGHAELVLAGELDVATATGLHARLNRLIDDDHHDLLLNLSALSFMDASGVGTLVEVHQRLEKLGGRLTLTFVQGIPERILGICGLLDVFTEPHSTTPVHRRQEPRIEQNPR
jgi:anti-sigma B factor antagonist